MKWYEWRWYALNEKWQRVKCWFVGHSEAWGDPMVPGDDDYCPKCFVEWPQDKMELPKYLTRIYVWVVERDWRWFNALDEWLRVKHLRWLPSWWEY